MKLTFDDAVTNSSQCTVMWAGVGLVIFWVFNLPRNLNIASYLSVASSLSIFSAVIVTVVDVAIEKPIGSTSLDVANAAHALEKALAFDVTGAFA